MIKYGFKLYILLSLCEIHITYFFLEPNFIIYYVFFFQEPLSSLWTFTTFPHMFPCTFGNILEMSIESCKLPYKESKKIQLEPSPWSSVLYLIFKNKIFNHVLLYLSPWTKLFFTHFQYIGNNEKKWVIARVEDLSVKLQAVISTQNISSVNWVSWVKLLFWKDGDKKFDIKLIQLYVQLESTNFTQYWHKNSWICHLVCNNSIWHALIWLSKSHPAR